MDQSIADILETCCQHLARGESIETCLAAHPSHRAELLRLLPIAVRARALASDPDPVYAAGAQRRFRRTVATVRASQPASGSGILGWLQRLALPVAIVVVLVLSGFGLTQAADNTLPDNPLYTVKQAQESVARVLTRGPEQRAALEMKFANQRLQEIHRAELLGKGPAVLRPLAVQMVAATTLATQQVGQTSGQSHALLVGYLRPLLTREQRALEAFNKSRNKEVAATARQLLGQIQADERSVGMGSLG
ncbi:MAG TPA: DUF5667 domain-containing protein [Chloroflexota bacterium]|nr:DUF5667 domain-containing protein [Chloroflexota bacterium]